MSDSLWPHGLQRTRPPCPSPTPGACQTHAHKIGDAIQPSHPLSSPRPLCLLPSIFPSIRVFSNESLLRMRWPKYWSSASLSVLPMNIPDWFLLGLTGLSPCSPRDSQESSPTSQFKSINSSVLTIPRPLLIRNSIVSLLTLPSPIQSPHSEKVSFLKP